MFEGNTDGNGIKVNKLNIKAKAIRIVPANDESIGEPPVAMRVELYVCPPCSTTPTPSVTTQSSTTPTQTTESSTTPSQSTEASTTPSESTTQAPTTQSTTTTKISRKFFYDSNINQLALISLESSELTFYPL